MENSQVFIEGWDADTYIFAKKTATTLVKGLIPKLSKAYDQLLSVGKNPSEYTVSFVLRFKKSSSATWTPASTAELLSQKKINSLLTAISTGGTRPYLQH